MRTDLGLELPREFQNPGTWPPSPLIGSRSCDRFDERLQPRALAFELSCTKRLDKAASSIQHKVAKDVVDGRGKKLFAAQIAPNNLSSRSSCHYLIESGASVGSL